MEPLTKQQRKVFDFLLEFSAKHKYMPSMAEIGKKFKTSIPTAWEHLTKLEQKGAIERRPNQKRWIRIL